MVSETEQHTIKFAFEDPEFDWDRLADPTALLSAAERDLWQRCATVRTFNPVLFEKVLRQGLGPDVMPFEALVAHPSVEALAGPGDRYQLRRSYREELLDTWWPTGRDSGATAPLEIPDSLRQFSANVVAYYRARGDDLDLLYHLVALNRPEAKGLLYRLYQEAQEAFDLPQCHAILHVLEDRQSRLGPELIEADRELRSRLETRSMWAQEYYETVVYLERDETLGLFEKLMEGKDYWILHVFGPGGLGKTMYLRRVIARHCVPQGIPCAAIDFDHVPNIARVAHEPWRLLLRIAEQLNPQIPGRPFGDLLKPVEDRNFIAEAGKHKILSPRDFVPLSQDERQQMRQRAVYGFIDIMTDVWGDRKFLLIFDTLENLRHRRVDLTEAFKLLDEVHQGCPGLRVILSGRFDLADEVALPAGDVDQIPESERIHGFVERFGDDEHTVELEPFSEDEARAYLESRRGLADEDLVQAIIDKSRSDIRGCNPFKLALLADTVEFNEDITAGEIQQYHRADLVYLIERVVDRILDDQVKWLLRWGVVPWQLTLDFVQNVMAPYLPDAMAGDSNLDDPGADPLPSHKLKERPFAVQEWDGASLNVEALWRRLYRYSSHYSWVRPASDLPDALVFHPDVVGPMRYLLREQLEQDRRIFLHLNRDAIHHYEQRADAEPDKRGQWLAEAIFHKYQTGDDDADAYWHQQMDGAAGDARTAMSLAHRVLLLADEAEWRSRMPGEDPPPIGTGVQTRAHYALARSYLEQGGAPPVIDDHLTQAEHLNPAEDPAVPPSRLAYIRAWLEKADGRHQKALETCQQALLHPADKDNELELRLLYADVLHALGRLEALAQYRQASELAQTDDPQRAGEIAPRLAAELEVQEQYKEAAGVYERLWQDAVAAEDLRGMGQSLISLMRVRVAMGQEQRAVDVGTRDLKALEAAAAVQAGLYWGRRCRAEIELARGMPDAARRELDELSRLLSTSGPPQETDDWSLVETDLRARIAAARLDIRTAVTQFERLAGDFYRPSTSQGVRCCLACARLYLEEVSDLRETERYLKRAGEGALDAATRVQRRLLEIQRLARAGQRAEAREAAERLAADEDRPLPPGTRAQVAVEAFIQTRGSREALQRLLDALYFMQPTSWRLTVLAELRRCPTLEDLDADQRGILLGSLPEPTGAGLDSGLAALRLADVHRVAGSTEHARGLLQRAEADGRDPLRLALLRQVYLAHDRLGWEPEDLAAMALGERDHPSWGQNRELCGLILLEHEERLLDALGDHERAALFLEEASSLLGGPSSLWSARIAALRARIAWARGEADPAQQEADRALEGFEKMGDEVSAEALRRDLAESSLSRLGDEARAAPEPEPAAVPRLEIGVEWDSPDSWQVSARTGPWERRYSADLSERFRRLFEFDSKETVSRSFLVEFKKEWRPIVREAGDMLFPPNIRAILSEGRHDITWRSLDPKLAWVPWEFISLEPNDLPLVLDDRCRYFHRHVAGTPVVHDLPEPGPSQASALILRMGEELEASYERGHTRITGLDLRRQYEGFGFGVLELSQPNAQTLEDYARDGPRIVHIVANIGEDFDRLFLDFGGEQFAKRRLARLTAKEVGFALREAGAAPLVILDIPAPPSITERLRQLCLRNAFAAELAASEAPPAILCTGLGEGMRQVKLTDALLQGLADARPIGEIARFIWSLAREIPPPDFWEEDSNGRIDEILPLLGTALFAQDPEQRFLLREE